MPPQTDQERLATIEQVLRDVRDDVHELREQRKEDHHRLRAVEAGQLLLIEEQKRTREHRDYQLRRLAIKLQWVTLGVGFGSFALGAVVALLAH
jgi:hypothetical protein